MWIFLAFLIIPLIEIALFVWIGGMIGLWLTLLIVVLTAFLGAWLLRTQGRLALSRLKTAFSSLEDPSEPLVHGAMILFSGALLLTPGFFTDTIGFALLIPAVRDQLFILIKHRIVIAGGAVQRSGSDVIDADYHEISPSNVQNDRDPPKGGH